MILVLAGTADGREIVNRLARAGHRLIACTATEYGGRLLVKSGTGEIITGRLGAGELAALITDRKVQVVVDATHPFAEAVTANARQACSDTGAKYIRFQRPALPLPESPLIHPVPGYGEAAEKAVQLARRTIFLATGTKTLSIFVTAALKADKRVVTRVLPDAEGLRRCLELGIDPGDIVAIQGPFSAALNRQLLIHFGADVLVTKESGLAGGFDAKLEAALDLSIPAVVVNRPPTPEGAIEDIDQLLAGIETNERTKAT